MKNLLSYKPGTIFKGREIKDWIQYNLTNNTSHKKIAAKMTCYMDIDDDDYYYLAKDDRPMRYIVKKYDPFIQRREY